jgi:penicillin-binding protein 1C
MRSAARSRAKAGGARRSTWLRRSLITGAALVVVTPLLGLAGLAVAKHMLGPPPIENANTVSTIVVDRNGQLLRPFTTTDGRWRLPVEPGDVDPRYLAILMAFEDKRFYEHGGVDVRALIRAAKQLVGNRRIVSGGSTLTMQVARLLEDRHERNAATKLRQIVRALQLEERLSKNEILKLYLRLAPFGGNIEGVRAASLTYFGKEPKHLSIGEAALLVALPQSPETRRPDRNSAAARRARDRVLDRARHAGVISPAEAERAKRERVPQARLEFPKLSPHLAESEVAMNPATRVHKLTLDRDLQKSLEDLVRTTMETGGPRLSAAMIVVDNATGEMLARVGATDYLDESRFGPIDMASAIRSPGSTLKPVIYGLAFEAGLAHPETLIEDRPVRFGLYAPKNFDDGFHGTVTIREALSQSLNIPAVKVLSVVGPGRLAGRFRRFGVDPVLPENTEPTLAMALGGVGFTLEDLTTVYTSLARGGDQIALSYKRGGNKPKLAAGRRLLSPTAAWYVTDILKDAPPPAYALGGRIAYKTGTSYGYRDAWAIGYDGRNTVAVWVGRPDGASTPGLSGHASAAPLLFDAFARLGEKRTPLPPAPAGAIKVSATALPPPLKRFRELGETSAATGPYLQPPVLIAYPPDRSEIEVAVDEDEPVVLKAEGGALPLTWLVDGAPIESDRHRREVVWQPKGSGFVKFSVIDAKGQVDRVTVRIR